VSLTFEHPEWLWLMLLAVPVVWVGVRWLTAMSRWRRVSAVLLRVALIALVTGMLAGMSSVRKSDAVAVIGVVDVSGSVRLFGQATGGADHGGTAIGGTKEFFAKAFANRGPEDLAGLVVFDGRALAVATPTRGDVTDRSLDVHVADGTDIGGALKYAAALIPPEAAGKLVLVSDGVQNAGDGVAAAKALGTDRGGTGGTKIDVVPVALSAASEVMVESVDAPPRAAAESAITVRVSLLATREATGTLSLLRNGEPLDINGAEPGSSRRLTLAPGRHVELIGVTLPAGQIHQFKAVWTPDEGMRPDGSVGPLADTRQENNAGEAFTYSSGKGSVLVVDGVNEGQGTTLSAMLKQAGIDVAVAPPEGIPDNLLAMQGYDLVILENVPADAVSEASQEALRDHVTRMGAGLVMVGGPDSLGAGGWKGSLIEPILPVRLDLPERLVQPDAAVVFVLDNSGSMGRPVASSVHTQQEIANEAAALAVRTLAKTDLIGVVVFNSQTSVLQPLKPNTDPKVTQERLLSIAPGGGTVMGPALEEAWRQLKGARAAVRHVVVLSDGRSMDWQALPGLAQRMKAEDGITVSTIGVGDEADTRTMGAIASNTGGKFYQVNNPSLLPRFFLKAIKVMRTPLIREGRFRPLVLPTASPLTSGMSEPPELRGLVLTQRRPEPTITYAMGTPTGEPLLAHWAAGLGQVAVFASDARADGWADEWIGWPGYRQMWTAVARSLARSGSSQRMELTTEVVGDELRLRLDAADKDGRPLDLLTVEASVMRPDRERARVSMSQTGPGVYEGGCGGADGKLHRDRLAPNSGGGAHAGDWRVVRRIRGWSSGELATNDGTAGADRERRRAAGAGRVAATGGEASLTGTACAPREARTPL
jgi:uncharacterized membrane protein